MAKEQEVAFKKAEKKFNELSALKINASTGRYTVNGKSLTTAEYRKVVSDARKERDDAKKLFDAEKSKRDKETKRVSGEKKKQQKQFDDLKTERRGLENEIRSLSDDIRTGTAYNIIGGGSRTPEEKQNLINSRALRIREIDAALGTLQPDAPRSPVSADAAERRATGVTPVVASPQQTRTQRTSTTPRNRTGAGTGTGAGGGTTVVVDGKKVKVGGTKWKAIIQEEFGGLWDVYNENPDVQKVIDKSVKEGWFNDETKLTAALQATNWYRTTEQSARQYAIELSSDPATVEDKINTKVDELRSGTTGVGITFDDATLRRLATNSIKFGWSETQTSNAIGSEAVALAQSGGAQGIANLRQGSVARDLRAKAQAYAQKPSDADIDTWVADIMTGRKSETQWEDLMRDSAKTQFRSLVPALDRGDDVQKATYAYKQQAAQTLGGVMDVTEIDWTQDKWNRALNYRDEKTGENRQMDLWEWNKYLRTLPEWQQTDEAKDVYRNVAYSLAQGFGKMA
jgi:hypothetical protein